MQSINLMKRHWLPLAIATLGLTLIFNPVAASADPEVFEASGATPADIQTAVDAFRNFLGPNNGVGGTFPDRRREINWDGVPDAFSATRLQRLVRAHWMTTVPGMKSLGLCRSQLVQKGVDRPFTGSINQQVKSDHDLRIFGANFV